MKSRSLEEQLLLHRLAKVDQYLGEKEVCHNRRNEQKQQEEAVHFYTQYLAPGCMTNHQSDPPAHVEQKKMEMGTAYVQGVYEVSKVLRKRKEEQGQNQKFETGKVTIEKETLPEEISSLHAYENLDCSQRNSYLLYSYNKCGNHSIIGKDSRPGGYGGRLTNGNFGAKA